MSERCWKGGVIVVDLLVMIHAVDIIVVIIVVTVVVIIVDLVMTTAVDMEGNRERTEFTMNSKGEMSFLKRVRMKTRTLAFVKPPHFLLKIR